MLKTILGGIFLIIMIKLLLPPTHDEKYSKGCPQCPNCGSRKKVRHVASTDTGVWTNYWCLKCGHKWG